MLIIRLATSDCRGEGQRIRRETTVGVGDLQINSPVSIRGMQRGTLLVVWLEPGSRRSRTRSVKEPLGRAGLTSVILGAHCGEAYSSITGFTELLGRGGHGGGYGKGRNLELRWERCE